MCSLASDGYPGHYEKGFEIQGLRSSRQEGLLYLPCLTKNEEGRILTNGGRV